MPRSTTKIVLAHGAWTDGSSWNPVIDALTARGFDVVAAPLPLTSLDEDIQALDRALDRVDGDVVLAAHAYAGAVAGSTRSPKVKALVYVAALAPAEGETVADVFHRVEAHPLAPKLAPDADGFIWLPDDAFANAFAQHAPPLVQARLRAVQRPISARCITVPVGPQRWPSVPSWYLVAQEDRMIPEANQRFMAERMQARTQVVAADHTPGTTAPDAVVALVVEAVRTIA